VLQHPPPPAEHPSRPGRAPLRGGDGDRPRFRTGGGDRPRAPQAEDALHQVFERMLRGGLEIEGSPVPYLYRAVRNAALNQIRNRSREVNFEDSWLEPPSGMQQSGLELQSSLKELPEEQREIILMHIWGEMSFEEVAAALEISPNTAASRYRYGLSKLREQFQVGTRSKHGQAG